MLILLTVGNTNQRGDFYSFFFIIFYFFFYVFFAPGPAGPSHLSTSSHPTLSFLSVCAAGQGRCVPWLQERALGCSDAALSRSGDQGWWQEVVGPVAPGGERPLAC